LLVWKPEVQELVYGIISEITNFGAFIDLGVIKGMIEGVDDRGRLIVSESEARRFYDLKEIRFI